MTAKEGSIAPVLHGGVVLWKRYELRSGAAIAGLAGAESHPMSPKPLIEVPVDVKPAAEMQLRTEHETKGLGPYCTDDIYSYGRIWRNMQT
jgi:hypothetical protein